MGMQVGPARLAVFGVALAVLVVVLLLTWDGGAETQVAADSTPVPATGLDFSLGVDVAGGGDDCDTNGSTGTGTKCPIPPNTDFTLKVYLNSLPGKVPLPTPPTPPSQSEGYSGFDLLVTYMGVTFTSKSNPDTTDDNPTTEPWPDCGIPVSQTGSGFVRWGCIVGANPNSTYTGVIAEADFHCDSSPGTITLVHGPTDTNLDGYAEGETLFDPTATLTPT